MPFDSVHRTKWVTARWAFESCLLSSHPRAVALGFRVSTLRDSSLMAPWAPRNTFRQRITIRAFAGNGWRDPQRTPSGGVAGSRQGARDNVRHPCIIDRYLSVPLRYASSISYLEELDDVWSNLTRLVADETELGGTASGQGADAVSDSE